VAAGEGQDLGLGHALAGGRDLVVLIGVLVAAADVEGDHAVQVASDRAQIPALGVAAVLADESPGVVGERRSVQAASSVRRGPTTLSQTSPSSGSDAGPSSAALSTSTSEPHRTQVKTSGRVLKPHRV
jgi:hypothetical protein